MITRRELALIHYAEEVLAILESYEEWNSDTIDDIGILAIDNGLAIKDEDELFKVKEDYTN
jgi:hypothetical protein